MNNTRVTDWTVLLCWVGVLGLNAVAWYAIAWALGTHLGL